MSLVKTIIILVIIVLALVIALGFANTAAAAIPGIKVSESSWKAVPELKTAHSMLTWLSVAGWITIALIIVAVICFFVFGGEAVEGAEGAEEAEEAEKSKMTNKKGSSSGGFMSDAVIFLAGGICLVIGVVAAMAATNLRRAQSNAANGIAPDDPKYNKAYQDCIIAASLGIGIIGLLIMVVIIRASAKHAAKVSQLKAEEARKERIKEAKEKKIEEKMEEKKERDDARKEAVEERKEEMEEQREEAREEAEIRKQKLKQQQDLLNQHISNVSTTQTEL